MTAPPRRNYSQRPRTRLAWQRTGLAVAVVALLVVRLALTGPGGWIGTLVAITATAGFAAVAVITSVRISSLHERDAARTRRLAVAITVATVGYAVLGLIVVGVTRT